MIEYPTLSDNGEKEAQYLLDTFKRKMKAVATEVLDELYTNIIPHIETDSWTNYRNEIMSGFRGYGNKMTCSEYDFKAIREKMLLDHREEIIKDLNSDLLDKIKSQETQIEHLNEMLRNRY